MATDIDDVLSQAAEWQDTGHGVALATVVRTWGSSPRPIGSQLAVNDQGTMVGSVSGGCIEGAVIEKAKQVIKSGQPELMEFGVTDDMAWEVGLSCGGEVHVFVEPIK